MSEQPPQITHGAEPPISRKPSLVVRARRVAAACDIIASMLLLGAAGLSLLLLALGVNGQVDWERVPLLITLCVAFLGIGFTLLLLARLTSLGLGWIGIILGLLLANSPLILAALGAKFNFTLHHNPLLLGVSQQTPGMGMYFIFLSVAHLIVANVYFTLHNRQLVAEKFRQDGGTGSRKREISFLPKCWEMYSCPDAVRNKCPNYIDQVVCWKRRRGCLCDHKLSTYLFHGPGVQEAMRLVNPQRLDLAQFNDLEHYPTRLREAKPRPWRERRPFCHNCAIFMEHQGYKYKRFNWVFLPISFILIVVLFPYFHLAYNLGARLLDTLGRRLTESGHLPTGFYSDASALAGSSYEYVLLAVCALLLMSYVVEFTDWCLLEWKI